MPASTRPSLSDSARRLHVFVDARMVFHSGIGRYIRNHLTYLLAQPFRFTIAVRTHQEKRWLQRYVEGTSKHMGFKRSFASPHGSLQYIFRPEIYRPERFDVCWFPHYLGIPWRLPNPSVVTVHDLIHLHGTFEANLRARLRKQVAQTLLPRIGDQATLILSASQTVVDEVKSRLPHAVDKVKLVPHGVIADAWVPLTEEQRLQVRRHLGLGRYVLSVGIEEERKNHGLLLQLLERLPPDLADVKLVLAGEQPKRRRKHAVSMWRDRVLQWKTSHPSIRHRLVELGEVNEFQLWKLYSAAEVFLFPSLEEGFGLPVLEAMACGAPVLSSDREPLRTVCGSVGHTVDPTDVDALTEQVVRLLRDHQLQLDSRQLGPQYVRSSWDWQKSTERLATLLRQASECD